MRLINEGATNVATQEAPPIVSWKHLLQKGHVQRARMQETITSVGKRRTRVLLRLLNLRVDSMGKHFKKKYIELQTSLLS